jgi:hypothetical protein
MIQRPNYIKSWEKERGKEKDYLLYLVWDVDGYGNRYESEKSGKNYGSVKSTASPSLEA